MKTPLYIFVAAQFDIKAPLKYGHLYIQDTLVGTQYVLSTHEMRTPLYF